MHIMNNIPKIDLHTHINFNLDDGCKNLDESIELLNQAHKLNIKYIACTTHNTNAGDYKKNFDILSDYAKKLDIELVVGNELILDIKTYETLLNNVAHTINNTKYVLVEVKNFISEHYIIESLENLIQNNFIPILAHPERLHISDIKFFMNVKKTGTLLQLNADSLNKAISSKRKFKLAKKLLKKDLIDIIASDVHNTENRNYSHYETAYNYVCKKYKKKASNLFYNTPYKIIKGE